MKIDVKRLDIFCEDIYILFSNLLCTVYLPVLSSNQEHRVEEMRSIIAKQKETPQKVAATAFSMGFMADLLSTAFQSLADDGFIYDPVSRGRSLRRQSVDYRKYMSLRRQHVDYRKYPIMRHLFAFSIISLFLSSKNQNQNLKCIYSILTKSVYKVTMKRFRIMGPLLRPAWSLT